MIERNQYYTERIKAYRGLILGICAHDLRQEGGSQALKEDLWCPLSI